LFALALASTVLATPEAQRPAIAANAATPTHVVLLVLDGVRYQEVFFGVDASLAEAQRLPLERRVGAEQLLPELHRLARAHGALLGTPGYGTISASGPEFVSLPGYAEVLTGRRSSGCWNNGCTATSSPSIADQLAKEGRASAIVTSWPDIARIAATRADVAVSSGRNGGATRALFEDAPERALEQAENEAPWPGGGDFRRDRRTGEVALDYLQRRTPAFLFISLGEPDEFAHQGNYAGYLDALQEADRQIGKLSLALDSLAKRGARTALFVTADHGRAANFRDHGAGYPESARVWLFASGNAIRARGHVRSAAPRSLADIAPTTRRLLGLPADTGASAGVALEELFHAARE
jgi:hypothetical protein